MATHTESQVKDLQESALEHLWVYLREPSDMAEKGEPQIFGEGKGVHVTDALEVWPESHWPGFALRQADRIQSYAA